MAREEDGLGNGHSPLGTAIALFLSIAGFASAIWWNTSSHTAGATFGWLMAPVSHTALEVGTVIMLILGLAFCAFVTYCNRAASDRLAGEENDSAGDPADTAVLPRVGPVAAPAVAPHARRHSDR